MQHHVCFDDLAACFEPGYVTYFEQSAIHKAWINSSIVTDSCYHDQLTFDNEIKEIFRVIESKVQ